mmetsp:Transcript_22875/g.48666  ORF Transcript_22875/g.48666 Transcript_22875/m.48666 type:complete len:133 (-) Transcript_22875:282-680(-)
MRSYCLFCVLCVLNFVCPRSFAEAFRSLPTTELTRSPSNGVRKTRRWLPRTTLFAEDNDDEDKTKEVSTIADPKDIEDLPMFSLDYNSDNVDYSQLPVPPFTSALVFFVSTVFTIYLYYVGITGGVATAPDL